jgi:diguanylate cyclase (GGDEF)-like protein
MPGPLLDKRLLQNCVHWFLPEFNRKVVHPLESQFPNYPLPKEVAAATRDSEQLISDFSSLAELNAENEHLPEQLGLARFPLLKQIVLRYRRFWAALTEARRDQTAHPEVIETLEAEVRILDHLVSQEWFQQVEERRIPRLGDFLALQYVEDLLGRDLALATRNYDEKFHILQAPYLFLKDLEYYRERCELRDASVAVAFVDIDEFKSFNSKHSDAKVDRFLLPRFMQAVEAHVFCHGHAYRQGGDEYLLLVPSISRELAIAFVDALRRQISSLEYPEIPEHTTVSIGVCMAEPNCFLTDRELRERANVASKFAKEQGKNRVAIYEGSRYRPEDLRIVGGGNA